ncbi:hypothetical protein Tco_0525870 [Tanacetum coccineum]
MDLPNTPYPSRRYGVSVPTLHKKPRRHKDQYAVSRIKFLEDINRGSYSKLNPLMRPYPPPWMDTGVIDAIQTISR